MLISKIDVLGTPATLNFFGNEKKKSLFGAAWTLLFFGFVVWSIYNASVELFARKEPKIVMSETTVEEPAEINLSHETFPFGFIVQTPLTLTSSPAVGFTDTSIYTVELQHKTLNRVKQADGTIKKVWSYRTLKTEKCTKEYFGDFASSFSSFTFLGSHCISLNQTGLDDLPIKGLTSSAVYEAISVRIKQCNNATSNNTCATQAKIDQYLSGAYFNALYIDSVMNLQNQSSPINRYREMYSTLMNPKSYKAVEIEIGRVNVDTDSNWIVETTDSKNSLKANKVSELVDLSPSLDKTLLICTFKASRLQTSYLRSYKKLPTVMAEVGGIANVFLAILLIVLSPYLKLKSREALMNEIFQVKDESKTKKKADKKKKFKYQKESSKKELPMTIELSEGNQKLSITKKTSSYSDASQIRTSINPKNFNENRTSQRTEAALQPDSPSNRATTDYIALNSKTVRSEPAENYPLSPISPTAEKLILPGQFSRWSKVNMPDGDFVSEQESEYRDTPEDNIQQQGEKPDQSSQNKDPIEHILKIGFESDREAYYSENEKNEKNEGVEEEKEKQGDIQNQETPSKPKDIKNKRRMNSDLQFWEYMVSLLYKPKAIKEKIHVIEEGVKNIDQRLDLRNILKKFCEIDKIIALLLDEDQLELFNNMPKPKILVSNMNESKSGFRQNLHKKITVIEARSDEEQLVQAYRKIKAKPNKTAIDLGLLDVFEEKLSKCL